jgi:MFS family permease
MKEYAVASVQTADFQKIASNLKVVLLKPLELRKKVDAGEVTKVSKKEFRGLWDTVLNPKFRNWKIIWIMCAILLFGYWDTFVVTYLANYITSEYKFMLPYVLIGVIAIPVFTLQMPFIKLSKKAGYYALMAGGLSLSAAAAFCFLVPGPLWLFLAFGLVNAVGYAAAMPLAQSVFSEYYNELYAKNYALAEIDSNTSAAPLKVTLNLANVFGSAFGGLLIAVGYGFSFFVYGAMLAGLLAVGVLNKKKWGL